jgi:hypothetical protein
MGVGACVAVVQGWTIVVCGGMVNCWHTTDFEGITWQEGTAPLAPALQNRHFCTLLERSDGGLVLAGGESADGVPYEDAWVSFDYGDHFRQLTAKLAPGFSPRSDAMYAMTKDDTVFVLGGSVGGVATAEVWKSAPGRVDLVGFGAQSMPTVQPELRMIFPQVGSTFTVVDSDAGLPLHVETLRLFEVYFVFSEEMIAGEGEVRIGPRVVCRPKFGTCIDRLSTVYPIPPMEFAKVTPMKGYLAVVVDTFFVPAGELLIDLDDDALQDLYGNRVAVSLNATYMVVKDATPAEVVVSSGGGLVPAADETGVDLAVLHVPFSKPVNLAANGSAPMLTLTPTPYFKSSVTYASGADLVQLTESALEVRWPASIDGLSPGCTYEVNLSGVVDTAGLLMKPASWKFTVREGWNERLGASFPTPLKYNFEELQGFVSSEVMAEVLAARKMMQKIQQDAQIFDIANNVSLIAESAALTANNPAVETEKTAQQAVTDGLTAQLDSGCTFPTTYTDGGATKNYNMYPPFPFPMTIEADHSFEVTQQEEVYNETLGYSVMMPVTSTITTQVNVSCLCYARDDADFVQWIGYVYSWFNFISCRDAEYYTDCAGIMPAVSASCSSLLDQYDASVAAYAALEAQYSTDTARLTTVNSLIDKLSYDGEDGPVFAEGWPANSATDVGGDNWDIILKWEDDVDLNATGAITVMSSTHGVVATFDVATSPYVIKTPPTGLSEYWITIFMTNASARGDLSLPAGGLSALGTVSVEIPEGVVVDTSQKYRPSKGIAPGAYSFKVLPLDLDVTAPTVIATAPAAGAEVPDTLSMLTVQLSEPVTLADGLTATLVCDADTSLSATIAPVPPLGANGTTTFLDFAVPPGLFTSVAGVTGWTLSLPAAFATDGAVTPLSAAAFSFGFSVNRPAAPGAENVTFESVAPPSASVILGFSEPMRPGVGSLLFEAGHDHNTLNLSIQDAARPVVENGMYGYRSAAGASPIETALTFAEAVLVVMPQYGFPPGETLALQPQAAGLFTNRAGQPSNASSVTAAIEVVEQVQFVPDSDLPSAMFGGAAFVTAENELFVAAGAGTTGPIGGVTIGATRRKVNCNIGVSPFSNCLNPCATGSKRSIFERLRAAPSNDGVLCVDRGGMAQTAMGSINNLLANQEEPCLCPVCVQGPTVLPPNIDLTQPVWESWRSVSSSNVLLGFTCAAGYFQMKDFLCSVGNVSEDRSFEYYGRWSIAEDACAPLNCTDESQLPKVAYGSQTGCTTSFAKDGQMLHGESCEMFCKAGYEPIPPDEPYITANGTVLPAREIICEFGKIQTAPKCQPQLCSPTPEERPQWDPDGGNMTCSVGKRGLHSLGSKCFIKCFPGFEAENGFLGPAKCAVPSYKSNTPEARVKYQQYVACPRKSCGTIREARRPSYKGEVVNCSRGDSAFEDACALKCNPGHEPKEPEDTSIECKLTEESNFTEVKWMGGGLAGCKKMMCPTPPPRQFELGANTKISKCPPREGDYMFFGDVCDVQCKTASYSLFGIPSYDGYSGQLKCEVLEDGTVDLNGMPSCSANRCFKQTAPSLNPISTMGCDGDDENSKGNPCRADSKDPICDGVKDGLRPGESCQVRCEEGYEPVIADEVVPGQLGDEIVLYCVDGTLQGPMYLAPDRVCKVKGDDVMLVQTVRSSLTISGTVDGMGTFKNAAGNPSMKLWSKDNEVRGILRKVVSDQISTPEIRFAKKDVELPLEKGRRLEYSIGDVEYSFDQEEYSFEEEEEHSVDDGESSDQRSLSDTSAPVRKLTVGSATIQFQILMQGVNEEPGNKELALLSAKEQLEIASNDTTDFVGQLRQELLMSPNWQSIYPPNLNVMIGTPVISVEVRVLGSPTPVPTPPPTPPQESMFWTYVYIAGGIAFVCFCAGWIRSCNKVGERKKGKKGAKVAPEKGGKGGKADAEKDPEAGLPEQKPGKPAEKKTDTTKESQEGGDKKKNEEDIEGKGGGTFAPGKQITKPSDKARGLPEDEEVPETGKPVAEPEGEPGAEP